MEDSAILMTGLLKRYEWCDIDGTFIARKGPVGINAKLYHALGRESCSCAKLEDHSV